MDRGGAGGEREGEKKNDKGKRGKENGVRSMWDRQAADFH